MALQDWIELTCVLVLFQIAYLALYRLVLSPLARFPGPVLAGLTSWYEIYYDIILPGQYMWKIQQMHKRYGPIVRIAPNEVHVDDPEYLDEIYAGASKNREKYAFQLRTLPVPLSMGGSRTHMLHRRRREALNPFFSKRSVIELESVIKAKCEQLARVFEGKRDAGAVINLSDIFHAFANDIVVQYSFGQGDNLLGDESKASILRKNISELLLGVKISQHFPWILDALNTLPFFIARHFMPPGALDMRSFSERIQEEINRVLENKHQDAKEHSIFYELRDNAALPESEKSAKRLEHEATLLVMAGTESVAVSIATTQFYLIHHPQCMARVRNELRSVSPNASWADLEKLPYLTGVILEGLRLSIGVTGRLARIAPDESLHYKQYSMPPGTPVSSTTLCVHTNETIFPDPWTFEPKRWSGKEGTERRKYLMSFGKGARGCIGINLAYAEMYLAIATAARFDLELFETDESDVRVKHDFHAAFPKLDSKGVRAYVRGKAM